jgi:hypothetical protein
MFRLHRECEVGDRRACIHFGIIIGENKERRDEWRRDHPEWFGWAGPMMPPPPPGVPTPRL